MQEGSLAIASDWNPGFCPVGNLVKPKPPFGKSFENSVQQEVFAGLTFRAAAAFGTIDRGTLEPGMLADFNLYPSQITERILNHQATHSAQVWKRLSDSILKRNKEYWVYDFKL